MTLPDKKGHFGEFGGKFVPETLMSLLEELEKVFSSLKADKNFKKEFARILRQGSRSGSYGKARYAHQHSWIHPAWVFHFAGFKFIR